MSKALRFISALGAVFFVTAGLSACGGGLPSDAVVQVSGTSITKAAFSHWVGVAATSTTSGVGGKPVLPEPPDYTACINHLAATTPAVKGQVAPTHAQLKTQCETQYKSLKQEVLGFLITSEWVLAEAKALGVNVTDAEVRKQFLSIKSQQFPKAAEFEKFLATSGQTVSDLLYRVKLNLFSSKVEQKILKNHGTVTPAQIEKYYNANKARFGSPEKRAVQVILTKTEAAAKKAKSEIESGQSFASVAKKTSIDPTSKPTGGLLTEVIKGQLTKGIDEAVFSASTGVLGGPVKTLFGYYVYQVTKITPGSASSFAQVKASIKTQLTATQQQTALTNFKKEFVKKWTAQTDCRSGFVVADCKQYKAPKGASTTTTPAG